jgi:glycosyltransferase involved in cell wall biosynthesis
VKPYLSVVIAAYNEENAIAPLCHEVIAVAITHGIDLELLVVDDCSTDRTYKRASAVAGTQVIHLRKNCGQSTAIEVGIRSSRGEYVVMLDGDGQNDPADIPKLLEAMKATGVDMVVGWRTSRKDTFFKKLSSRLAWSIRRVLLKDGVHDSGCTLKLMSSDVAKCLKAKGQLHRFFPAIAKINGYKVGEIPVNHRPRLMGTTKYTWHRGVNGIADMVLLWYRGRYKQRPIHLFGGVAIMIGVGGTVVAIASLPNWNVIGDISKALILVALAIQVFGIGILVDSIESAQEWDPLYFVGDFLQPDYGGDETGDQI